jgi:hypothetical protein
MAFPLIRNDIALNETNYSTAARNFNFKVDKTGLIIQYKCLSIGPDRWSLMVSKSLARFPDSSIGRAGGC